MRLAGAGLALALLSIACEALIGAEFDRQKRPTDAGELDADDGDASTSSPFEIVQGLPAGETLLAIWGAGPKEIFAVGTNGVHVDYFGGTWSTFTGRTVGRDYYGVWGTSGKDVYAVGTQRNDESGVIQHFDGIGWSDEYIADRPLYGVWGADGLVYAVGENGMIYGKTNGGEWAPRLSKGLPANPNVKVSPASPILWSICGNSGTNFAIAADLDRIFHYVGNGDFVNLDPALDRTLIFRTVFALPGAKTSIFVGSNHYGVSWLASPTVVPNDFDAAAREGELYRLYEDRSEIGSEQLFIRGIWGNDAQKIFVGDKGKILTYATGSNATTPLASPTHSALNGVWGSSLDDIWIVGERELILHGSVPR